MALFGDMSNIPDLAPVAPGEYDLSCKKAKEITSGKGRKGVQLIIDILNEDNAETLFHTLWLPMESDDDDKAMTMMRMNKEFLQGLGLEIDGSVELSDFVGLEFSALLDTDEYEGKIKNVIKKIT